VRRHHARGPNPPAALLRYGPCSQRHGQTRRGCFLLHCVRAERHTVSTCRSSSRGRAGLWAAAPRCRVSPISPRLGRGSALLEEGDLSETGPQCHGERPAELRSSSRRSRSRGGAGAGRGAAGSPQAACSTDTITRSNVARVGSPPRAAGSGRRPLACQICSPAFLRARRCACSARCAVRSEPGTALSGSSRVADAPSPAWADAPCSESAATSAIASHTVDPSRRCLTRPGQTEGRASAGFKARVGGERATQPS